MPVKPPQRRRLGKLMSREVAGEGSERCSQFLSIPSVAFVSKTAEPMGAVSLADGCAGTNYLPALAPRVARGTHLTHPPKPWGQVFPLPQFPLPPPPPPPTHTQN